MSQITTNLKPVKDLVNQVAADVAQNELEDFAKGQTWQDMTSSRAYNTTYTNTTDKPIMVNFIGVSTATFASVEFHVGGALIGSSAQAINNNAVINGEFIVPAGMTYKLVPVTGSNIYKLSELRQ
jgi:hypothetical protein